MEIEKVVSHRVIALLVLRSHPCRRPSCCPDVWISDDTDDHLDPAFLRHGRQKRTGNIRIANGASA